MRSFSKAVGALLAATMFLLLGLAPLTAVAQTTNLPPRTHSRETRMSLKARELKARVTRDIATAKGKGKDVSLAEKHRNEGDRALETGHLRIAVEYYEAAEKALGK